MKSRQLDDAREAVFLNIETCLLQERACDHVDAAYGFHDVDYELQVGHVFGIDSRRRVLFGEIHIDSGGAVE